MKGQGAPVTILKNNCDNCFKCIRECEVKAINYNHSQASIVADRCIVCGNCIDLCPSKSIIVSSDVDKVKKAIKNNSIIVASLSPGWVAEFKNIDECRMIEALNLCGFTYVSQSSIGATMVKKEVMKRLSSSNDCYISNSCPVITKMITTYYPSLSSHIIDVMSPVEAHAKYLKATYGQDAIVVTIDSCVASKSYNEKGNDIYASLTFSELRELMKTEHVDFDHIPGNNSYKFHPFTTTVDNQYIQPRGVYNTDLFNEYNLDMYAVYDYSGIPKIQALLSDLENEEMPHNTFIELFACKEGCISGAGCIDAASLISKRRVMSGYTRGKDNLSTLPSLYLTKEYKPTAIESVVDEQEIAKALALLGIDPSKDAKNCGGCGYYTCRDFAVSLAAHDVDLSMCVHYEKRVARSKFKLLLKELSSGVAIVGKDMKVIEANKNFADYLGVDPVILFDTNPELAGVELSRLLQEYQYLVLRCLNGSSDRVEQDIQVRNKMVTLTAFKIPLSETVGVIVRNRFLGDVRNTDIIKRTNQVIQHNLDTVQKIAFLLGENASKTEAMLNSIVESHSSKNG